MSKYLIIFIACILAACTSHSADGTNGIRYYQLPDSAFRAPVQRKSEIALQIVLAEQLANENLLYQTDDYHINFANKNLWSTPLSDALAANLANKLNKRSTRYAYLPQSHVDDRAPILKVYIDRFQGTYRRETQISGYAQLADGIRIPFAIHTPQYGDGYDAMVQSLDVGLNEVAKVIGQ